jgi:CubicO group peptidase (beta-lactamase class C family)
MISAPLKWLVASWLVMFLATACAGSTPEPLPPYWPTEGWRSSTPEQQGLDSPTLLSMFHSIQAQSPHLHSLLIIRHGYLVTEAYFYPFQRDLRHNLHSCTKSITSALAGVAIQEGLLEGVNQPILELLPRPNVAEGDPRKQAITLEHLLTMTSGLDWPEEQLPYFSIRNPSTQMYQRQNRIQYVLGSRVADEPGRKFNYNSGGSHLLSAIIQERARMSTLAFAQTHLFQPLGISNVFWPADPQGINLGEAGLEMTPRDMAKFGYLYLQKGTWAGKQIVPADWVKASTETHIETHWGWGYGYQWWIRPGGGYSAIGWGGQYIFVLPDQDMVVVFTGGLLAESTLPEELVDNYIVPSVKSSEPLPENPAGMASLEAKIKVIEAAEPEPVPPLPQIARTISGKTFKLDYNDLNWHTMTLSFAEKEAQLDLLTRNDRFKLRIGLDNVFRVNSVEHYGPDRLLSGPLALRGFWQNNTTFIIHDQVLGQADGLEFRYTFAEDSVQIEWTTWVEGESGEMIGKLYQ